MFTLNNKILLTIISLAFSLILICGVIGIVTHNPDLDTPLSISIAIFILVGTYLLAKNGTFIKSDEYRFTRLGIALFILGILMKIMHWPYAKEIMLTGYLSIPSIYLFHMIKNKRTQWPEFVKLFLTLAIVLSKSMSLIHIAYYEEVALIATVLVLILLVHAFINKKILLNE